jgi:hypothetical protein
MSVDNVLPKCNRFGYLNFKIGFNLHNLGCAADDIPSLCPDTPGCQSVSSSIQGLSTEYFLDNPYPFLALGRVVFNWNVLLLQMGFQEP